MRRESRAVRQSREQRDSATRWLAERMRSRPRSARLPRARTPQVSPRTLATSQAAPSSELSRRQVTRVSAVGDAITNYAVDACSTNSSLSIRAMRRPTISASRCMEKRKLRLPTSTCQPPLEVARARQRPCATRATRACRHSKRQREMMNSELRFSAASARVLRG